MKALIVDDERLARIELRHLLDDLDRFEAIEEASSAPEALDLITRSKPDVVFLDIQMPGMNGFELLEKLPPPVPSVIFTTAFNEYALKAFEVNALDYLLKPIDPSRLVDSISRLPHPASAPSKDEVDSAEPESADNHALTSSDRVFVRDGDRCWFIEVGTIRLLESEGNYTRVHFQDNSPVLLRSLNALEARLSPQNFFRANRSQIINLQFIEGIEPWFSGNLRVTLKGGKTVEISRRQSKVFRERLSL